MKLISLGSIPSRLHFSIKHQDKKVEKLRLEFNPRKIGEDGLSKLHAVLSMLFPNGWAYVTEHGHITRNDIAVDIPDIRMDEFLFLSPQGLTVKEWGQDGHLQTMYLGKPKGNQTAIYSVKQKRIAQGKPWTGKTVVRVERRLNCIKVLKLTDLPNLPNPFAKMVLTPVMPPPPPHEKEWQWSMFEDSVKVRGLMKALALLPGDRRKKYRAHLSQHKLPWWNPDVLDYRLRTAAEVLNVVT